MLTWLIELFRADPAAAERALREAELSHDQVRQELRDALKAALQPGVGTYVWPKDVYDDRVVYEVEGPNGTTLYQRGYTIDEAGTVTLAVDVTEVQAQTIYQPVTSTTSSPTPAPATEAASGDGELTEAVIVGDVIPLIEKSVRRDGTVPVKVIQPGWGSSGYYDAAVLERDGALAFPKGTKMFWNHPTITEEADRPERDLRDLAAETVSDARFDKDGPAGPGLYSDAKIFGAYKESVDELAPHMGVSIRTAGTAKPGTVEGRTGNVVESLLPASVATSIDFVTTPGAGGQVLQLFEAARGGRVPNPQPPQEDTPVSDELSESARQRLEAQDTEIARLRETVLFREARDVATAILGPIDLPDVTRARLVESLAKNPPVVEESKALDLEAFKTKVDEAVKSEVEYLARAAGIGDGQVRGMGSAGSAEPLTEADADKALTAAFQELGLSESAAAVAAGGREH